MKRNPVLPSRAEAFINGAESPAPAPAPVEPAASEQQAPAPAPEKAATKPTKPTKPKKAPADEPAAVAPWEAEENQTGHTPYSIRWPKRLYAQMEWAKFYVPGPENSVQKLVIAGMTEYMEKLIKKHYKQ